MAALYWLVIFGTSYRFRLLQLAILAFLLSGCNRHRKAAELEYVSVPQAVLRDRVATVYSKVGTVKNGDRVEILERERRFARVRTDAGMEGWIEQRYLVPQQVYNGFQKLAADEKNDPLQASGRTRNDTNIHLEPGRETEHLYQLTQGNKIAIFKRATAEKELPGTAPQPANSESPKSGILEDWWLIRDPQGHVGWVLSRMVDLDVPLDIAQYAEGQRIVAFFVLDQVTDGDKKVPQYLVALTEPKDGLPFDYNQVRVFTWNVKRHRYETAYRERNLDGVLPVTVSRENFEKEGTLPVFVLRVKDDSGSVSERKYKLNTPIVRRVLAPGEEAPKPASKKRRR
ncbi:MAG: SH3 domain-containing protein [Acidobacteriaceae bacterium]|nr:SH3 domain-containing protein [Acidobacteriaceae bacterium]